MGRAVDVAFPLLTIQLTGIGYDGEIINVMGEFFWCKRACNVSDKSDRRAFVTFVTDAEASFLQKYCDVYS